MITEIFLELLKQEAANLLKVGSDRIKVELKQLSFYDYDTETGTNKEVNGLFFILDSFLPNPDDAFNSIFIKNGNCFNIHQLPLSSSFQYLSHSFKNVFCEHISINADMKDSYSPIVVYLSFEKF